MRLNVGPAFSDQTSRRTELFGRILHSKEFGVTKQKLYVCSKSKVVRSKKAICSLGSRAQVLRRSSREPRGYNTFPFRNRPQVSASRVTVKSGIPSNSWYIP